MIFDPDTHSQAGSAYLLELTRSIALTSSAGAAYTLHIAWPAGPAPVAGWPVVYMLDGETFGIAREIMRYQVGAGAEMLATPRVLVAIGYPGASRRGTDYAPEREQALAGRQGGAPAFRRFLLDTVCPLIAAELPIDRRRQTLMGHSLGGLFVLETMFEQRLAGITHVSEVPGFETFVASSPSVWWADHYLVQAAARFVLAAQTIDMADVRAQQAAHVLLSSAEYEQVLSPAEQRLPLDQRSVLMQTRQSRRMVDGNRALAASLASVPGLAVSFRFFEDETHRSAWPRAIAHAMRD